MDQAKIDSDHYTKNAEKIRAKELELEQANAKTEAKEINITKIYQKLAFQRLRDFES